MFFQIYFSNLDLFYIYRNKFDTNSIGTLTRVPKRLFLNSFELCNEFSKRVALNGFTFAFFRIFFKKDLSH